MPPTKTQLTQDLGNILRQYCSRAPKEVGSDLAAFITDKGSDYGITVDSSGKVMAGTTALTQIADIEGGKTKAIQKVVGHLVKKGKEISQMAITTEKRADLSSFYIAFQKADQIGVEKLGNKVSNSRLRRGVQVLLGSGVTATAPSSAVTAFVAKSVVGTVSSSLNDDFIEAGKKVFVQNLSKIASSEKGKTQYIGGLGSGDNFVYEVGKRLGGSAVRHGAIPVYGKPGKKFVGDVDTRISPPGLAPMVKKMTLGGSTKPIGVKLDKLHAEGETLSGSSYDPRNWKKFTLNNSTGTPFFEESTGESIVSNADIVAGLLKDPKKYVSKVLQGIGKVSGLDVVSASNAFMSPTPPPSGDASLKYNIAKLGLALMYADTVSNMTMTETGLKKAFGSKALNQKLGAAAFVGTTSGIDFNRGNTAKRFFEQMYLQAYGTAYDSTNVNKDYNRSLVGVAVKIANAAGASKDFMKAIRKYGK